MVFPVRVDFYNLIVFFCPESVCMSNTIKVQRNQTGLETKIKIKYKLKCNRSYK